MSFFVGTGEPPPYCDKIPTKSPFCMVLVLKSWERQKHRFSEACHNYFLRWQKDRLKAAPQKLQEAAVDDKVRAWRRVPASSTTGRRVP